MTCLRYSRLERAYKPAGCPLGIVSIHSHLSNNLAVRQAHNTSSITTHLISKTKYRTPFLGGSRSKPHKIQQSLLTTNIDIQILQPRILSYAQHFHHHRLVPLLRPLPDSSGTNNRLSAYQTMVVCKHRRSRRGICGSGSSLRS